MDGAIYLNNAATSFPKAEGVAEAVSQALLSRPGSAHRGGIESFDVFAETRRALSRLMGVSAPERIALGPNSTWGLNQAIQGFPLKPGDTVLSTDAEHNSVLRPLYRLWKERDIDVRYVGVLPDGGVDPEVWSRTVKACRPKLCVFTHASNVTGRVNPAPELASAARECGAAVLLDASQTLGCVPVRAEEWNIDMLAFTGHKYLLGPQGTGGLYVRPGLELSPVLLGGTGVKSDLETMPEEMPLHLEAGTGNEPSFCGLLAALEWAEKNPADGSAFALAEELREGLKKAGAQVIVPTGEATPVVSFNLPGRSADGVGYELSEGFGITCRSGLHCAPRIFAALGCPSTVRLSLSRFTSGDEIAAAISAVKEIAGG